MTPIRRRSWPLVASPGFTLVEMMVVVCIVAVLVVAAAPLFNDLILEQRLRSTASDLAGDLSEARAEAMKRSRRVVVASPGGWLSGWTISVDTGEPFIDSDGDGVYSAGETYVDSNSNGTYDAALTPLKIVIGLPGSDMRICGVTGTSTNAGAFVNRVVFRGDGTVANAGIGAEDGIRISRVLDTTAANGGSTRGRDIRISPAGRVAVDVYYWNDPNRNFGGPCP